MDNATVNMGTHTSLQEPDLKNKAVFGSYVNFILSFSEELTLLFKAVTPSYTPPTHISQGYHISLSFLPIFYSLDFC